MIQCLSKRDDGTTIMKFRTLAGPFGAVTMMITVLQTGTDRCEPKSTQPTGKGQGIRAGVHTVSHAG